MRLADAREILSKDLDIEGLHEAMAMEIGPETISQEHVAMLVPRSRKSLATSTAPYTRTMVCLLIRSCRISL